MMIYVNPMPSKRRKIAKARKPKAKFVPLKVSSKPTTGKTIPSAPITPYQPPADTSYRKEVSAKYTVAIAYNKGAYQVISRENIQDIGR